MCFSCLPDTWVQQSGLCSSAAFNDAVATLRKTNTGEDSRAACIDTVQKCIADAFCTHQDWPDCPLCVLPKAQVCPPPPRAVDGPRLWTQKQLWDHCGRHLLRLCFHGSNPQLPPIPVEKVPPIFQAPDVHASETLYNTSRLKGLGGKQGASGPTAAAVAPLQQLLREENISAADLRDHSTNNARDVKRWLRACGVSATAAEAMSAAKGREWLLRAFNMMVQGKDGCHMFVSAKHATGGTADLCCPHGVEIATKILFEEESTRDYLDLMRSLLTWSHLLVIDASCGVVTAMEGNYPAEAKALWGDHRGTFKCFLTDKDIAQGQLPDLSPVEIPEFRDSILRQQVMDHSRHAGVEYAKAVKLAKGGMRLERHPALTGTHWQRVICSDRLHQSPYLLTRAHGKKQKPTPHRKPSCCQHLISICPSLSETRTNMMESLNGRKKPYLATICTTDPVHHLVITEKLRRFSNRRIIAQQDEALARAARPGEEVFIDTIFGFAHIVCSRCKRCGHSASDCQQCMPCEQSESCNTSQAQGISVKPEPVVSQAHGMEPRCSEGSQTVAIFVLEVCTHYMSHSCHSTGLTPGPQSMRPGYSQ